MSSNLPFQTLLDQAPLGMVVADFQGRNLYVNDAVCQMTGCTRDALLARPYEDFLPPDDRAKAGHEHLARVQREGRAVSEFPVVRADGQSRWWRVEATPLDHGRFVAFMVDITERQALEKQLERERWLLQRAQDLAKVGWWEFDLASDRVTASDVVADIYGLPRGRAVDIPTAQSMVDPSDRPRLDRALADLIAGRAGYDVQFTVLPAAGSSPRRVHSRAEYDVSRNRVFGVLVDLTAQLEAVEAVARNEARLRAIFDSARDYIYLKDRDLRYTHVNEAALEYIGRPREEVIGRDAAELFPPEIARRIQATDRAVLAGHTDRSRAERNHGGSAHVLETVKVPVRDAAGEIVGLCGVSRDITDVRRLEEQLRQSQKMEAVGRLAGGIAHDFNNLLTPILGYATMLREQLAADEVACRDLAAIAAAGERARDLTANLLAFSRKQMLDRRPVSLNQVIEEAQEMLRRLLRENVQIHLRLAANLGLVHADTGQLHNVLINLAVNGADAMPDGGVLSIETQDVELDAAYVHSHPTARQGPQVMLAITDTGVGMDSETQQHAFEPFFTTKPVNEGTGLGLATVHGIVQQHGGTIEVYSEPAHGTTFKIYLPRIEAAPLREMLAPELSATMRGDERVLVVEDDDSVRQLTAAVLRKFGYEVTAAASPADAVAFAVETERAVDLLLTDVVMPGMNGAQLHRALSDLWPDLPALFMSGYTSNIIAHHGVLAEGVEFIQKPFMPEDLARKVREILDG